LKLTTEARFTDGLLSRGKNSGFLLNGSAAFETAMTRGDMTTPNRTNNRFRIGALLLNAGFLHIGRKLRTCLLVSLIAIFFNTPFVSSASASVTCHPSNYNNVLAAGAIVISSNATPGSVVSISPPTSSSMSCSFLNTSPYNTSGTMIIKFTVSDALAPGFADVYKTNIDGLGVRFVFNASTCNVSNSPMTNGVLQISCDIAGPLGGPNIVVPFTVTTSFVVYSAVANGALTLSSIPVLDQSYWASDNVSKWWSQWPVYTGGATGAIKTMTCSVQTTDIAVSLPTLAARDFGAGVGAVAGKQAFQLGFTCPTSAKVSIVIMDVSTPSNRSNVLTLSPDSTAQGIGIQLLKGDGTPIFFGPDAVGMSVENQWLIGTSLSGVQVLPLSAQYIRTGTVRAGSIKALATFTMTYN
jgi:type 1 fimbria pilin